MNKVDLDEAELPTASVVDYLLKPATSTSTTTSSTSSSTTTSSTTTGSSSARSPLVIFCVDSSGSMCGTTYSRSKRRYLTRLDIISDAICEQINICSDPTTQMALVHFSNKVTILGDGLNTSMMQLNEVEKSETELIEEGKMYYTKHGIETVKNSSSRLMKATQGLTSQGMTALGPALATCLGIAEAHHTACVGGITQIIIATDGLANVGIGQLETTDISDEAREKVQKFYTDIGERATSVNCSVSLLSIPGQDCNIEILSNLVRATGGEVSLLDITAGDSKDFHDAVREAEVIATKASMKLISSPLLVFKTQGKDEIGANVLSRGIGNITRKTELLFEYSVKNEAAGKEFLPFQVQIYYTKKSGDECVRIISNKQDTTQNWDEATREADAEVLGVNMLFRGAEMAREGRYSDAVSYLQQNKKLISETGQSADLDIVMEEAHILESTVKRQQDREKDRNSGVANEYRKRKIAVGDRERSRSRSRSPTYRALRNRDRDRNDFLSHKLWNAQGYNLSKIASKKTMQKAPTSHDERRRDWNDGWDQCDDDDDDSKQRLPDRSREKVSETRGRTRRRQRSRSPDNRSKKRHHQ